jgi:hypothetical protein
VISLLLTACTVQDTDNSAPTVQISSPSDGSREQEGVPFSVVADLDDDAGVTSLAVTWSISPETDAARNPLRTDKEATLFLPDGLLEGTWDVEVTVEDDFGATASGSVQLNITQNAAPKVTIEEPEDGARYSEGNSVGVSVMVRPGNDSMADIWLTWGGVAEGEENAPATPNADGYAIFFIPDLARGRYKLRVTAHDQGSETGEDEVTFHVD